MRGIHYFILTKNPGSNTLSMYRWLIALILFSALHWGVLTAWVIYGSEYQQLHYPYMVILPGFAIGGTAVLGISRIIGFFYPLLIFIHSFVMGLFAGGTENLIMISLALFSLFYVKGASRASYHDYRQAIKSHEVAEERAKEMYRLSITDQLTGLKNRMFFNNQFSDEWMRCRRYQLPLSILMIDLDFFKKINDTYGHIAGDKCLKQVASVLELEIHRATDTLARYGGEEFVVMLPDTDLSMSKKFAEKLVRAVADFVLNEKSVPVSCSIGVASAIPDNDTGSEKRLMAADDALYQAKEQGKNRSCIST
jgi:diguanylate cyclase (GGDEF)-like protein